MFVEDSKNCGIYCWTNKVNDKKYIGQSDDLHRRYSAFLYFNNTYSGDLINKARIKYNSADYWNYEVLEYCTKEELNEKEIMYIYLFNTTDRRLGYNLTSGGNRPIFTAEAKAQMSRSRGIPIYQINKDTNEIIREWESARQAGNELGIDPSSITKCCRAEVHTVGGFRWCRTDNVFPPREKYVWSEQAKLNCTRDHRKLYKKHQSEEFKRNLSEKLKGREISEEQKQAMRVPKKNFTIKQFDLDTHEFIKEYDSIAEASRQTNVSETGIRHNLTGKYTQAGGYRWKYGSPIKRRANFSNSLSIVQLTENGEIIKEWEQANLAAEELNISTKTLRNICKRKTKVSNYGIILRYKKDYVPGEVFQMKRIIEQIDENGEIVKHWVNAKQAAKDLNINITTLYRYLNGQIKHSRLNLILRYKDK